MGRYLMEKAATRPRPGTVEHWQPHVPVTAPLSGKPDDRVLHHLAVAYDHIDELRHHLAVFRETVAAPAPAAAEHEGRILAHHAVQMERALDRARHAARRAGSTGLLRMVEEAYAERRRLQRAVQAALGDPSVPCHLLLASFAR